VANAPQPIDSLRERLAAFAGEWTAVEQGSVEALHRTRVASRRLRELVALIPLDRASNRTLKRQLRKVTRQLGAVRELDVLVDLIDEFDRSRRYSPNVMATLRWTVDRTRATARARLTAKLPAGKLERLVNRLERAIDATSNDDGGREARARRQWQSALDARLARRAAGVRAAIDIAGALYAPEPLHHVRIALKKLRYAAELAQPARRRRLRADVADLKAAQDLLGRMHDYEVLIAAGRDLQASLDPPVLATWRELKRLVHDLEDDCRQMHARYMRDRSRLIAIADRFGADEPNVIAATIAVRT